MQKFSGYILFSSFFRSMSILFLNIIFPFFQIVSVRYKQKKFPKIDKKLQAAAESLASRGYIIACLKKMHIYN